MIKYDVIKLNKIYPAYPCEPPLMRRFEQRNLTETRPELNTYSKNTSVVRRYGKRDRGSVCDNMYVVSSQARPST